MTKLRLSAIKWKSEGSLFYLDTGCDPARDNMACNVQNCNSSNPVYVKITQQPRIFTVVLVGLADQSGSTHTSTPQRLTHLR